VFFERGSKPPPRQLKGLEERCELPQWEEPKIEAEIGVGVLGEGQQAPSPPAKGSGGAL